MYLAQGHNAVPPVRLNPQPFNLESITLCLKKLAKSLIMVASDIWLHNTGGLHKRISEYYLFKYKSDLGCLRQVVAYDRWASQNNY